MFKIRKDRIENNVQQITCYMVQSCEYGDQLQEAESIK